MSKRTAKKPTVGSLIELTEDIGFIEPSGESFEYSKGQLAVVLNVGRGKDKTVMVSLVSKRTFGRGKDKIEMFTKTGPNHCLEPADFRICGDAPFLAYT